MSDRESEWSEWDVMLMVNWLTVLLYVIVFVAGLRVGIVIGRALQAKHEATEISYAIGDNKGCLM